MPLSTTVIHPSTFDYAYATGSHMLHALNPLQAAITKTYTEAMEYVDAP